MHEHSLLRDLINKLDQLINQQGGRRLLAVKIKFGALSHISPCHFREHYLAAVRGTQIENAMLSIEQLTDETDARAQEIILDSIEVEE